MVVLNRSRIRTRLPFPFRGRSGTNDIQLGPVGPTGPQGATGATGAIGAYGKDGADGRDGVNGNDGANGAIGPQVPPAHGPTKDGSWLLSLLSCKDGLPWLERSREFVATLSRLAQVVYKKPWISSSARRATVDVTWVVNHHQETLLRLAPREVQVGDRIVIPFGCSVPMVIRAAEDVGKDYSEIIGEAFNELSEEALAERIREFQIV